MSSAQVTGYAPLPESFRGGLTACMIFSAISCAACFTLLCVLAYQTIQSRLSRDRRQSVNRDSPPQGYFWLVQLFIADFIQSFTSLFAIRYLTTNSLITGPYCTFQAVGLISGDVGSAIWTFVITVNTFLLLAGGRNTRAWVIEKSNSGWGRWVLCAVLWLFILFSGLFGLIFVEPFRKPGHDQGPYYDQSGAGWCYIGGNYFWERIFFTYAFLFLDMITLTTLYCILFFFVRAQTKLLLKANTTTEQQSGDDSLGTQTQQQWEVRLGTSHGDPEVSSAGPKDPVIVTKSVSVYTEPLRLPQRSHSTASRRMHQRMTKVSVTMLIYPVIYIILTMPLSVSRIAEFAGQEWGLNFVHFGAALFDCTGFTNVLLYTSTRKGLVSWNSLNFWKKERNEFRSSTRRNGRWSARGTPVSEIHPEAFDTVEMARSSSKRSKSSFAALEEDISKDSHLIGGAESNGVSRTESWM